MSRSDFARCKWPSASGPAMSGLLQRRHNGTDSVQMRHDNAAPAIVRDTLRTPGQPLDQSARSFFEPRFGRDFSDVRIHTDDQAAASSEAVNAQAYTVGSHVVFDSARHDPNSGEGRALLAHELSHVVQQDGATPASRAEGLAVDAHGSKHEREADLATSAVMAGRRPNIARGAKPGAVQRRDPKDDPVHQGMIDDYRKRSGDVDPAKDGGLSHGPIDAQIKYQILPMEAKRKNYSDAVTSIQSLDPDIYKYLSKTGLNGGVTPVSVGRATDNSTTPPTTIDFTFNLTVRTAPLVAPEQAKFTQGALQLTPSGQNRILTADMTMEVTDTAALSPAALTQALYHEGLHMLLYIQNLMPPATSSPHVAALANYRTIAKSLPQYQKSQTEIEVSMDLDWRTRGIKDPPDAGKAAKETLEHIIEEKYVFDQETVQFGTKTANAVLARGYLQEAYAEMGARFNAADPSIARTIAQITAILDTIDSRTAAARPKAPAKAPAAVPQPKKP